MVALECTSALSVRCGNDSIVLTPDQERLKGRGAAPANSIGKARSPQPDHDGILLDTWLLSTATTGFYHPP